MGTNDRSANTKGWLSELLVLRLGKNDSQGP